MAVISCYYFFTSSSSSSPNLSHIHGEPLFQRYTRERKSSRRNISSSFAVLSAHSNPRILKSNRKSRYGQMLSPYSTDDDDDSGDEDDDDDDDEEEEEEDEDEDEDEDEELSDYSQDEFIKKSFQSGKETNTKQGRLGVKHGKTTLEKRSLGVHASNKLQEMGSIDNKRKMKTRKSSEKKFRQLSEELDLDEKWFPLLDYLSTFGFKDSHFIQIYERHMPSLQINMASAQERLDYLLSIGVKHRDIRKILLRQPQILEYTVENNLKSHVAFLVDLGIPDSRIGQIITAAPSLLSYSVEQSLKPTVRYLIEEVGIKRNDLSKVVQLSPQILVQRIDNTWSTRFGFLSKELGAPRESIVKMVRKHPQLLHYNIEDGILPRINFLRSIGMRNSDIVKILTSLTQDDDTLKDY
ncbi:hypothetical protein GIB67_011204 [Kingdonia uniflora]|uniref:Uncharacterized protein n=1 Tax=Kingdonia uniflora TaxID=39325 RepID=A0A7J7M400_9MAGN|nr:hypothetical protein GIB67_011204 [Kingdonia uniflora]